MFASAPRRPRRGWDRDGCIYGSARERASTIVGMPESLNRLDDVLAYVPNYHIWRAVRADEAKLRAIGLVAKIPKACPAMRPDARRHNRRYVSSDLTIFALHAD